MKKIFYMFALLAVIAWVAPSCSSTKNAGTVANVSRGKFTGTWTVTSITYDGLLERAVQNVFDQAPPSAFRGSTWKLTNSGNGMYTLNDGTSQSIFWSVNNATPGAQMFQFKKIYQGDKPKNVAEGYQLYVAENNGTTMTLKSPVAVGSGTAYIIYTFAKN